MKGLETLNVEKGIVVYVRKTNFNSIYTKMGPDLTVNCLGKRSCCWIVLGNTTFGKTKVRSSYKEPNREHCMLWYQLVAHLAGDYFATVGTVATPPLKHTEEINQHERATRMVRDMVLWKELTELLSLEKSNSEARDKGVKTTKNHEVYTWRSEIHE